jgi:hypothetical protein
MELRFACPTCGQHLSATPAQIGVRAPCPNCNAAVTVPVQSTLPPKLPDFSPRQQPQQNPQGVKRSTFGVKTFTSVFLAILAAVGVIVLIVFLAAPFVRYSNAKRACLTEIHSAIQGALDVTGSSPEMRLAQMVADMKRARKARETLIGILENKPWSLPLSHGESKLLSESKSEFRRETASALKNALESYRIEYGDYPQGAPEENLKALDGGNPKHIQFFDFHHEHLNLNSAGELVDPWGKPYPLDVTQLKAINGT